MQNTLGQLEALKLYKKLWANMSSREHDMFKTECKMREFTLHDNLVVVNAWSFSGVVRNPVAPFTADTYP